MANAYVICGNLRGHLYYLNTVRLLVGSVICMVKREHLNNSADHNDHYNVLWVKLQQYDVIAGHDLIEFSD